MPDTQVRQENDKVIVTTELRRHVPRHLPVQRVRGDEVVGSAVRTRPAALPNDRDHPAAEEDG